MSELIQHVVDAISLGALYALFSLSVAVIFGVARVINFANGELMTIAGYMLVVLAGLYWPAVIVVTIIAVVAAALLMDRVVFRWQRKAPATTLLILSFGVSYLLQSVFMLTATSRPETVNFGSGLVESVSIFGIRIGIIDFVTIGASALLVLGLTLFLNRTRVGRELRAASEDFGMARLLGVKANRVIAYAFAISGFLAAVAGILLMVTTATVTPTFGVEPVLIAFIAVIVGGVGSLTGAAAGGMVLGALTILLQVVLPESLVPYREAFVFALVIGMLLARPNGLIPGRYAQERI